MSFIVKRFSSGGKIILFVGSTHDYVLEKIKSIKNLIESFNPEIILVEDSFDLMDFDNEEMAIQRGGEMGYVSFIAKKSGIVVESNDPRFNEDILFLEKKYSRDISFLYFFLRQRSFLINHGKTVGKNLDGEILQQIRKETSWNNYDYSLERVNNIFNIIFLDRLIEKDYSDFFNPTLSINLFNEVTRELNKFRDNFMIGKLKKVLKKYNHIFIIKGSHHLISKEKEIRELLKNG